MPSTPPDYRFIRFRFYAPIGVTDVSIQNSTIAGSWKKDPLRYYGEKEKTLAERFANWRHEPKDIELFTRRYGPLAGNLYTGLEFEFPVLGWLGSQQEFRAFWRLLVRDGAPGGYEPLAGNTIEIRNRWLDFRCGDLWTFMSLELLRQPEKLRVCLRPDCHHPYFVAQHGKEQYCSTDCANWSQAQLKKHWHEQQREKRKATMKGKHAQTR